MNEAEAQQAHSGVATQVVVDNGHDLLMTLANQIDMVGIIFVLLTVGFIMLLVRWHNDKTPFDLRDAFMKNGRVSRDALFECGGFISLTFVLIHQEFKDVVTDWYVLAYGSIVFAKGVTNILKGTPPTKPEEPRV